MSYEHTTVNSKINDQSLMSFEDIQRASDFYTQLRAIIRKWLTELNVASNIQDVLLVVPDLFATFARLALDERVGMFHKLEIITAITYVINPFDIFPDYLPLFGLLDDALTMILVLTRLLNVTGKNGEDIVREHWSGNEDILVVIKRTSSNLDDILGKMGVIALLYQQVKTILGRGNKT